MGTLLTKKVRCSSWGIHILTRNEDAPHQERKCDTWECTFSPGVLIVYSGWTVKEKYEWRIYAPSQPV